MRLFQSKAVGGRLAGCSIVVVIQCLKLLKAQNADAGIRL